MIAFYCFILLSNDYSSLLSILKNDEMAVVKFIEEPRVIEENHFFNGHCPICERMSLKSQVYTGGTIGTLMGWMPYYDEDGNYHNEDPNKYTTHYSCSQGHGFTEEQQRGKVKLIYQFPQKNIEKSLGLW